MKSALQIKCISIIIYYFHDHKYCIQACMLKRMSTVKLCQRNVMDQRPEVLSKLHETTRPSTLASMVNASETTGLSPDRHKRQTPMSPTPTPKLTLSVILFPELNKQQSTSDRLQTKEQLFPGLLQF